MGRTVGEAAGGDVTSPSRRDAVIVCAVALLARLVVLVWSGGRFPPVADGTYYETLALRLARGLGYTWLWPDGVVTYAAHYPVGYPALLAAAYRVFGPSWMVAGSLNATLGAAAAWAAHRLASQAMSRRWALGAGMAVALHPGLLLYTPAIMTEGITAALLAIAAGCAALRTPRGAVALGLVMGLATLVRPQSIALAPMLGGLAVPNHAPGCGWTRLRRAALVTVVALTVCAPWTLRNCVRMNRCALVSVNGGWNLLIGAAPNATGNWSPVDVPKACQTVWDEAGKDACFEREARQLIAHHPAAWLARIPARLAATFDYCGAAGYYLHEANPSAFDERAKLRLGVVETLYERALYLGALLAAAAASGAWRRARYAVAAMGALALVTPHAYLAVVALLLVMLLRGPALLGDATLFPATAAVLFATIAVHAAFFGAGRYGLVVFPLVSACAFGAGRQHARSARTTTLTVGSRERDTTSS